MANVYTVRRNIEFLEEIVGEVPEGCTELRCNEKGLRSLRGIERLPQITTLNISDNQIQSLEFITGSNVTNLDISDNQIQSLEFITGSNVTKLYISGNPCYNEFIELGKSIEKAKEKYPDFLDVKGADWIMEE